jgi:hypothetical protein
MFSHLQVCQGWPNYFRGVIPLPGIRGWGPPTSRYSGCAVIPGEASHFPAFEAGVLQPPGIRAAQLFQVRHPTSRHLRLGSSHLQVSGLAQLFQVRHPTSWHSRLGSFHLQVSGLAQLFQVRHPTSRHSRLGSSHFQLSRLPSYSR